VGHLHHTRLYCRFWFVGLMIPPCWLPTICFIVAFRGRAPCLDIDGIRGACRGSLIVRHTNHSSGAVVPFRHAHRPWHFLPESGSRSLDEWLFTRRSLISW